MIPVLFAVLTAVVVALALRGGPSPGPVFRVAFPLTCLAVVLSLNHLFPVVPWMGLDAGPLSWLWFCGAVIGVPVSARAWRRRPDPAL